MREAIKKEIVSLNDGRVYSAKTIKIKEREFYLKRRREDNGNLTYSIYQLAKHWSPRYESSVSARKDADLNIDSLVDQLLKQRELGREAIENIKIFEAKLFSDLDSIAISLIKFKELALQVGKVVVKFSLVLENKLYITFKIEDKAIGAIEREFKTLDASFISETLKDLVFLMENDLNLDF